MESNILENLTAFEMAQAERISGQSLASLEDPAEPKVGLLGALGWVSAKRGEPTLTYDAYMGSRTLKQITEELGLGDEDAEGKA